MQPKYDYVSIHFFLLTMREVIARGFGNQTLHDKELQNKSNWKEHHRELKSSVAWYYEDKIEMLPNRYMHLMKKALFDLEYGNRMSN